MIELFDECQLRLTTLRTRNRGFLRDKSHQRAKATPIINGQNTIANFVKLSESNLLVVEPAALDLTFTFVADDDDVALAGTAVPAAFSLFKP